ncbi:hypothetical protein B0J13DRAFT_194352 [Dactylonectria estremocensis]|uniref:Uncharacterized protein n=1 Tax=Dactylonectria estremocensis TaxID=1079267 RepID=A0A9P9DHR4_9HYPO|nr:hypothetical protein B0J13DRAFT_194352 [Dactylonectria estremocensis]
MNTAPNKNAYQKNRSHAPEKEFQIWKRGSYFLCLDLQKPYPSHVGVCGACSRRPGCSRSEWHFNHLKCHQPPRPLPVSLELDEEERSIEECTNGEQHEITVNVEVADLSDLNDDLSEDEALPERPENNGLAKERRNDRDPSTDRSSECNEREDRNDNASFCLTVRMTKLENLMKMRQSGRTNPQRLEIHRRLMYSLQSTRSIGIPWLIQAQKSGSAVRLAKNARFVSEERVVKPNLTLMRYNRGRHHSYYPQADLNFHVRNLPEPNQLVSCPKLYTVCLESTFSILPFHRLGRLSRHQETTEPSNRSCCLTVETPFVSQQLPSAKRLRQMFRSDRMRRKKARSSEVNSVAGNKTMSYPISYYLHGIFIPCSASDTVNHVIQCKIVQISYKYDINMIYYTMQVLYRDTRSLPIGISCIGSRTLFSSCYTTVASGQSLTLSLLWIMPLGIIKGELNNCAQEQV